MKKSLSALLIFIVIMLVSIVEMSHISKTGLDFANKTDIIKQYVINEDYSGAIYSLEKLENDWEKEDGKWYMVIDHQDIEDIEYSVVILKEYIILKEKSDILVEVVKLRKLFENVVDDSKVNIFNIV